MWVTKMESAFHAVATSWQPRGADTRPNNHPHLPAPKDFAPLTNPPHPAYSLPNRFANRFATEEAAGEHR